MTPIVQEIAALSLVAAALAYLAHRFRPRRASKRPSPCSACQGCFGAGATRVEIEVPKEATRSRSA